jgi:hypothetical protein
MAKIVSLTAINDQKKLALQTQLNEVNAKIDDVVEKEKALCEQRRVLESQLYSPEELAKINIQRRAAKLSW